MCGTAKTINLSSERADPSYGLNPAEKEELPALNPFGKVCFLLLRIPATIRAALALPPCFPGYDIHGHLPCKAETHSHSLGVTGAVCEDFLV